MSSVPSISGFSFALAAVSAAARAPSVDTSSSQSALFGPSSQLSLSPGARGASQFQPLSVDFSGVLGSRFSSAAPTAPLDPKTRKAQQELLKRVAVELVSGRGSQARELLEKYIEKNRPSGEILASLAQLEQGAGEYDKAERSFRRAETLSPGLGYEQDALNARKLREPDEKVLADARRQLAADETRASGTRLLRALTARSPKFVEARVALAEEVYASGERTEALAEFAGAVQNARPEELPEIEAKLAALAKKQPRDAFVKLLIGRSQLRRGDDQAALATLESAYTLGNANPLYGVDLAAALVKTGDRKLDNGRTNEALADLHRAKSLDPNSTDIKDALADAYVARAELRVRRNALGDAINDFRVALTELGPNADPSRRKRLAGLLFATGSLSERQNLAAGKPVGAEAGAFQTAFEIDPQNALYRQRLADVRVRQGAEQTAAGKFKEAAGSYRAAYDLYRNNTTYRSQAVTAYRAWGDDAAAHYQYDDAILAFDKAYQLDTSDGLSKNKLAGAFNTRGLMYRAVGDLGKARDDFRAALNLFPDNTEYQANLTSAGG